MGRLAASILPTRRQAPAPFRRVLRSSRDPRRPGQIGDVSTPETTLAKRRYRDGSSRPNDSPFAAGSKVDARAYPIHAEAELLPGAISWLRLFKWTLVIPHAICLALLWIAFVVLTAAAFVAVLFTGRYPRRIFDFNVRVLRWTWRVTFYGPTYAIDRYPPFRLAHVPDYPARLHIDY